MSPNPIHKKCHDCGRDEPLWSNCFRERGACPNRDHKPAFAGGVVTRPDTQVITVTNPGYEIALFFDKDGGAEAIITAPGAVKHPIRVNIAPPAPGRRIVVERHGTNFSVVYKDATP